MSLWPKEIPDLLDDHNTAYKKLDGQEYEAEKDLLKLYRDFVSEMLRISLAGVAVFGFLAKFLKQGESFGCSVIFWGLMSMSSFVISSVLSLLFLYASAEGYRYYIAGLRAKYSSNNNSSSNRYLEKRKEFIQLCIWSKAGCAILIGIGSISACIAIILIL